MQNKQNEAKKGALEVISTNGGSSTIFSSKGKA